MLEGWTGPRVRRRELRRIADLFGYPPGPLSHDAALQCRRFAMRAYIRAFFISGSAADKQREYDESLARAVATLHGRY